MIEGTQTPRRKCRREGCERHARRAGPYCFIVCERIDVEFSRLQTLYETAGDPSLSRDAWLTLCEIGDLWTEFEKTRGALFREITSRGLPVPPA